MEKGDQVRHVFLGHDFQNFTIIFALFFVSFFPPSDTYNICEYLVDFAI